MNKCCKKWLTRYPIYIFENPDDEPYFVYEALEKDPSRAPFTKCPECDSKLRKKDQEHLSSQEAYEEFYEKEAIGYHSKGQLNKLEQKRFKWLLSKLIEREFNDKEVAPIVDLGCQDGPFTIALGLFGWNTTGIEISRRLVRVCLQNKNNFGGEALTTFILSTAERYLEEHPDKFNTIVCFELLEHVIDPDKLLNACRTSLKEKGQIYICVPNEDSWSWDKGHVRKFGAESLHELVSKYFYAQIPRHIAYDNKNAWLFCEGRKE